MVQQKKKKKQRGDEGGGEHSMAERIGKTQQQFIIFFNISLIFSPFLL